MKKANYICAGIFSLIGIYIIFESTKLKPGQNGVPGAGFFPIAIAVLMIIASIGLVITMLKDKELTGKTLELVNSDTIRVYITMAALVLYIILLPIIGFCVTSFIMLLGLIQWYADYGLLKSAIFSACITGTIFIVFDMVLKVPMGFGFLI